jgi:hypothetical protein
MLHLPSIMKSKQAPIGPRLLVRYRRFGRAQDRRHLDTVVPSARVDQKLHKIAGTEAYSWWSNLLHRPSLGLTFCKQRLGPHLIRPKTT